MSFMSVPPGSSDPALQPLYELEPSAPVSRRRQIQNALYRGRWMIVALAVAGLVAGGLVTWLIRPYYVAVGSIVIEHPNLHNAEITPQEYPPPIDPDREMQTELTIFGSRAVAMPVIRRLDLYRNDPDMARALAATAQSLAKKGEKVGPGLRDDIANGIFAQHLKLLPDKLSNTVHVEYGGRDPKLDAAVVNATTAEFLARALYERGQQGSAASHWMRRQLQQAENTLVRDDGAVAAFQRQHAYTPLLYANGSQSGLLNRLTEANSAWSAAQAQRISDEAALRSYQGGVVAALPAELRDPAIDRATENVGAAEQQLTSLETTYQDNFPLVVEARAQLTNAQQHLAALKTQVRQGLEQRLAASQQRESELASLVGELNHQAASASGLELQFGALKGRADAQRSLVTTLQQKLAEVELEASLPPNNLRVLDAAVAPLLPAYPQRGMDLGLGLLAGLAVGVGVALAREYWSETLTASDAVRRGLGPALAPLGMIADRAQPLPGARALLPAAAGGHDQYPGFARIAANLVARCGTPPRAILITSANPGEGKTTTVCQLGLALAQSGWRTLVVDADDQHPGCHSFFGLPNAPGLQTAQAGRKAIPLAVAPHLDVMPCETNPTSPLQIRSMAGLLEQWREHYDYILIDSPPGNLTGEAVLLSSLVEGVLVVLQWGRTRLPEAQQLCEELARARAPLLGTVFNRADPSSPAFRIYRAVRTAAA